MNGNEAPTWRLLEICLNTVIIINSCHISSCLEAWLIVMQQQHDEILFHALLASYWGPFLLCSCFLPPQNTWCPSLHLKNSSSRAWPTVPSILDGVYISTGHCCSSVPCTLDVLLSACVTIVDTKSCVKANILLTSHPANLGGDLAHLHQMWAICMWSHSEMRELNQAYCGLLTWVLCYSFVSPPEF